MGEFEAGRVSSRLVFTPPRSPSDNRLALHLSTGATLSPYQHTYTGRVEKVTSYLKNNRTAHAALSSFTRASTMSALQNLLLK